MKSTVNKITDSAKRRDTIGRNRVQAVSFPHEVGIELFSIQNTNSSDNVEKITNIIIKDRDSGNLWLLKYRIMSIDGESSIIDAIRNYLDDQHSYESGPTMEGGNNHDEERD